MGLHVLWAIVVCFSALMYTIFDGFDLGVGILLPFVRQEGDRDTMVDSITPVWDANETWLILAGVGLFGGFTRAYSLLLPALYIPFVLMLVALILRGVAMEFRFMSTTRKNAWDMTFAIGSIIAAFCQGVILGNLMEGIGPDTPRFASPFALFIGISLIATYALTGATWLNLKTRGLLQRRFKTYSRRILALLLMLFIVTIWGRFNWPVFTPRYGPFGIRGIFSPVSVIWYSLTLSLVAGIYLTTNSTRDRIPFLFNMLMTVVSAAYILSGLWPYVVPPSLTIYNAGSPPFGNKILLISSYVIIPVILGYLLYSYSVFKGKVNGKDYEPVLRAEDSVVGPVRLNDQDGASAKQISIPWPLRIIIAIAGILFFFVALGVAGEPAAILSIAFFIIAFLTVCLRLRS